MSDDNRADSSPEKLNRVGAAALVSVVLSERGIDPVGVFTKAKVEMAAFADPDALVPIGDLARVANCAVEASGRSDFGLLIADRARAQMLGLLGQMFLNSDDLRAALHTLIRYFHLNARGGVAVLTVDSGVAEVQLALDGPYGSAAATFEDAVVGIFFHLLRAFLGDAWQPTEVLLSHAAGSGGEIYRRFFGVPVRFDALGTAILFPAEDLRRRMIGRETERQRLETAATTASSRLDIGFDEKVRWSIRTHLGRGKLTIGLVGRDLGMSGRTLNRRLAERDLTFAQLLQSVRFAAARQLLVESATPLVEIASAVGYAEASVFSSAFRSWSGVSPSEWRRQHGRA